VPGPSLGILETIYHGGDRRKLVIRRKYKHGNRKHGAASVQFDTPPDGPFRRSRGRQAEPAPGAQAVPGSAGMSVAPALAGAVASEAAGTAFGPSTAHPGHPAARPLSVCPSFQSPPGQHPTGFCPSYLLANARDERRAGHLRNGATACPATLDPGCSYPIHLSITACIGRSPGQSGRPRQRPDGLAVPGPSLGNT
jgi:hypothetical protein